MHRVLVVKHNKQIKANAKKRSVMAAKSSVPPEVSDRLAARDGSELKGEPCSDDNDSVASLTDDKIVDETYLDQGYDDTYNT